MDFLDANLGWLAVIVPGQVMTVYAMIDGAPWREMASVPIAYGSGGATVSIFSVSSAMRQAEGQIEVLGGDDGNAELFRTYDGAATWHLIADTQPSNGSFQLPFGGVVTFGPDVDRGWLTGSRPPDGSPGLLWVFTSTDGGGHWARVALPTSPAADLGNSTVQAPLFTGARIFLPVDYVGADGVGRFFVADDPGARFGLPLTWHATQGLPTSLQISQFVTPLVGYVIGASNSAFNGELFKTTDGGATWNMIPATLEDASSIDFVTPMLGWVITKSHLEQTVDGGRDWVALNPQANGQERVSGTE